MTLHDERIDAASDAARGRFIKGFATGTEKIDRDARTVRGVASTINLDRDREVILPSAFAKTLVPFQRSNAPFLAAHTHRTGDGGPSQIGWVTQIAIAATDVPCTFTFAKTDLAEQWWQLASDPAGKGIAFSIGFIPKRRVFGAAVDLARNMPELAEVFRRADLGDDDRVAVYTEIELLEISAVPVPSNRESLQALAAKMADAFGLEGDGRSKAMDTFADLVAARTGAVFTAAITDLKAVLIDRIQELHELLPDDVNGGASGPGEHRSAEDPDDPAPDAVSGERAGSGSEKCSKALRSASDELLALAGD